MLQRRLYAYFGPDEDRYIYILILLLYDQSEAVAKLVTNTNKYVFINTLQTKVFIVQKVFKNPEQCVLTYSTSLVKRPKFITLLIIWYKQRCNVYSFATHVYSHGQIRQYICSQFNM